MKNQSNDQDGSVRQCPPGPDQHTAASSSRSRAPKAAASPRKSPTSPSTCRQAGRKVLSTREPGGTEIGEQVRNIIVHNSRGDEMCAETELLLFAASRAQLVREIIAPNLMKGVIVLCDRYIDSSTVYQGVARNLSLDPVQQINQFAVGNVLPDLTIVLDVPTRVSLDRIQPARLGPAEPHGAGEHRFLQEGARRLPGARPLAAPAFLRGRRHAARGEGPQAHLGRGAKADRHLTARTRRRSLFDSDVHRLLA